MAVQESSVNAIRLATLRVSGALDGPPVGRRVSSAVGVIILLLRNHSQNRMGSPSPGGPGVLSLTVTATDGLCRRRTPHLVEGAPDASPGATRSSNPHRGR
jgi:hypothetical protein